MSAHESDAAQSILALLAIVALFSFSMGIRFHIDLLKWRADRARKQLGRAVLNSMEL